MPVQQQVLLDSLAARVDSLETQAAADTAAPDTATTFSRIATEAERAGQALEQGDFTAFGAIIYQSLVESFADFLPLLIRALVILAVLFVIYRFAHSILVHTLTRSKRVDQGLESLLRKTFRIAALAFIAVVFLGQLGFNITALLAGLSIAGIAVGFAARDTLENFIAGVTVMMDRPFRVGDNIEIEDIYGSVDEITLRSTRLRTLNNTVMVLPNTHMITTKLINHTMLGNVRVDVPFGIAYKEYPQEARDVVLTLVADDTRVDTDHPPRVDVTELNDSSIDMALRFYIKNPRLEYFIRWEYIEKVREALREADIEIPYPHLSLFWEEAKALEDAEFRVRSNGDRPRSEDTPAP